MDELFLGYGLDFVANHLAQILAMFVDIRRFLFRVGIVAIYNYQ